MTTTPTRAAVSQVTVCFLPLDNCPLHGVISAFPDTSKADTRCFGNGLGSS